MLKHNITVYIKKLTRHKSVFTSKLNVVKLTKYITFFRTVGYKTDERKF